MWGKTHCKYTYGYVHFKTSHVNGAASLYHHVINHESGHILGLADPNYPVPGNLCGAYYTSVMHSNYYCGEGDLEWPNGDDRWCVEDLAFDGAWGHCNP